MVDTQYKSTDDVRTESQWLKKGYIVKDTATGIKGWNNRHCTYRVTRYSKDDVYEDIETAKARIKKIRHKEYEDAKARKASCVEFEAFRADMNTKTQWICFFNRMPKEKAKWHLGRRLNKQYDTYSFGDEYWYCHYDDTEEIIEENVKPIDN